MKRFNIDVRSMQRAFEQTPKVFQTVCMNMPVRVALGVVDHATVVIALKIVVRHMRVRANGRALFNVFSNISAQFRPTRVWHNLQDHPGMLFPCATFQDALHSGLPKPSVSNSRALILVHVASFCSDITFVCLTNATHLFNRTAMQCEPDTMI